MNLKLSVLFIASFALFSGIASRDAVEAYFHSNEDGVEDLINTALTSEFGALVGLKDDILSDDPAIMELHETNNESKGLDRNGNPLLSTKPLNELTKNLPNLRDFVDYKKKSILMKENEKDAMMNEMDETKLSELEKKDLQLRREMLDRLNNVPKEAFSSMSNKYRDEEMMNTIVSGSNPSNDNAGVGGKVKQTLNTVKKAQKVYQTKQKVNGWRERNSYSHRRQMKSLNELKSSWKKKQNDVTQDQDEFSTLSTTSASTSDNNNNEVEGEGGFISNIGQNAGNMKFPTFNLQEAVSKNLVQSTGTAKEQQYLEKQKQNQEKDAKKKEKEKQKFQKKIAKFEEKGKDIPDAWFDKAYDDEYENKGPKKTKAKNLFWNKYTKAGNKNAKYFDEDGNFYYDKDKKYKPPPIPDYFVKDLPIKKIDGAQYRCAWPAPITAANANYAYPDLHCNYLVAYLRGITPERPMRITAEFPPNDKVAYFSYQSSDIESSFTIKSIRDYELKPKTGENPYVDPDYPGDDDWYWDDDSSIKYQLRENTYTDKKKYSEKDEPTENTFNQNGEKISESKTSKSKENTYEIFVTVTGKMGFRNELGIINDGKNTDEQICKSGCSGVVILRYYTTKVGINALTPDAFEDNRLFGFVDPPEITQLDGTKDFTYKMPVKKKGKWKDVKISHTLNSLSRLQTCDYDKPTLIGNSIANYFNNLLPEMKVSEFNNKKDNFVAFVNNEALFPNKDARYLWTSSYRPDAIPATDPEYYNYEIIGKMTGKLPLIPADEFPPMDQVDKYDVRYQSISSVAAVAGAPTINTITAKDIEKFYTGEVAKDLRKVTNEWYEKRRYSVVFASNQDVASKCLGDKYSSEKDMLLSTTFNGLSQEHWGAIFRQVISKWQRIKEQDKSVAFTIDKCQKKSENENFDYCKSPKYLESRMGSYYPKMTYYKCNINTGEMEELTEDMNMYNK